MPSIANFRLNWLKNRVAQAEIAALAVEAAPDKMLSDDLKTELLAGAGVLVVSLKKGDSRQLILRSDSYDMNERRSLPVLAIGDNLSGHFNFDPCFNY